MSADPSSYTKPINSKIPVQLRFPEVDIVEPLFDLFVHITLCFHRGDVSFVGKSCTLITDCFAAHTFLLSTRIIQVV